MFIKGMRISFMCDHIKDLVYIFMTFNLCGLFLIKWTMEQPEGQYITQLSFDNLFYIPSYTSGAQVSDIG